MHQHYEIKVLFIIVRTDFMTSFIYFLFPSLRLHISYKTKPVSNKVLDKKWAI